jgi:MOSC domain-containing protein YiiM
MRVVSVNVGMPKTVSWQGRRLRTGIFKEPVEGRIKVRKLNLEGDAQADLRVHGGEDKAVYAYPVEHYRFWSEELGRDLPCGQFGENLTVEGLLEDQVQIGDIYRVGTTRLQVSQPRTPCHKLAARMASEEFPHRFLASGRSGFYLRVLQEGELGKGDTIHRESRQAGSMTVYSQFRQRFPDPLG